VDQHCVVSFSSLHGNELDACSPIFNSVATLDVKSGLKLSTSSMLKRSPKNGVLKTPGAAALRAISSP